MWFKRLLSKGKELNNSLLTMSLMSTHTRDLAIAILKLSESITLYFILSKAVTEINPTGKKLQEAKDPIYLNSLAAN